MNLQELQATWNAQSDKYNQWDDLGLDEIVAFAQHQAIFSKDVEITTLTAERDAMRKDVERLSIADLVWDHDDPDCCYSSINEMLTNVWQDGYLEVGAEFTVRQAARLPKVMVRVTSIDEDGDVKYEEIHYAAMTKEAG